MNNNWLEQLIKETFCAGWLMGFLADENIGSSDTGIEYHINNDFQKYLEKASISCEKTYSELSK